MDDILHNLNDAVFSAHVYTQIFTTASTNMVLNGTSVTINPPMVLNVRVRSCTSGSPANVFLTGNAIPNALLDDRGIILL